LQFWWILILFWLLSLSGLARGVVGCTNIPHFLPLGHQYTLKMQKRWYQIPKIIVIQNTPYLKILAKNTKYLGIKHPTYRIPKTPDQAWFLFSFILTFPSYVSITKQANSKFLALFMKIQFIGRDNIRMFLYLNMFF